MEQKCLWQPRQGDPLGPFFAPEIFTVVNCAWYYFTGLVGRKSSVRNVLAMRQWLGMLGVRCSISLSPCACIASPAAAGLTSVRENFLFWFREISLPPAKNII